MTITWAPLPSASATLAAPYTPVTSRAWRMWRTVTSEIGLRGPEGEAARDAADRDGILSTMKGQRALASGATNEEGRVVNGEADRTAVDMGGAGKATPAAAMTATQNERNLDEIFMMRTPQDAKMREAPHPPPNRHRPSSMNDQRASVSA